MPQVKADYVVSFSSEHPDHPVNNLLLKDVSNKRWICSGKGDASNSVVLQLEKSVQITSIHIGNYHSALIEVLVGRSEASYLPFEVLLSNSSFMTPGDSRNSENISNVRNFTTEQLVMETRTKKWDRVRIVCSQPYNRHVQYGLSFIHFFSSDTATNTNSQNAPSEAKMLGRFKLKCDKDNEDVDVSFKPGELFAKAKETTSLTTDAQIRQAGSLQNLKNPFSTLLVKTSRPSTSKIVVSNNTDNSEDVSLSRKKAALIYLDSDDDYNEKVDSVIQRDRDEKNKNKKEDNASKKTDKDQCRDDIKTVEKLNDVRSTTLAKRETISKYSDRNIQNTSTDDIRKNDSHSSTSLNLNLNCGTGNDINNIPSTSQDRKRKHSPTRQIDTNKIPRSTNDNQTLVDLNIKRGPKCLDGVVFVLSGYVNPKRRTLRDTAVSLGARYSLDWNSNCTHLICAFSNTPKHEQVRRSGGSSAVVIGQWIEDCSKEKACLPWKWYATDPSERTPRDSLRPTQNTTNTNANNFSANIASSSSVDISLNEIDEDIPENTVKSLKIPKAESDDDAADMERDTDDEIELILNARETKSQEERIKDNIKKLQTPDCSEGSDTDIENSEITKKAEISSKKSSNPDPYKAETESDSNKECSNDSPIEPLPDFFSGIKFYIDPKLADENISDYQLKRYILAYSGDLVHNWPDPKIDVAITIDKLVDNLRVNKGKKCKFLRPDWIMKCNDKKTLYSYKKFEIR